MKNVVIKICRQCKQEFEAWSRNHRYCSQFCVTEHNIECRKEISGVGMFPDTSAMDRRRSQARNARDLKKYRDAAAGRLNPIFKQP